MPYRASLSCLECALALAVTRLDPRPGTEPVFNLEVETEHVYYVSAAGVLVHNSGKKYASNSILLGESMATRVDPVARKIGASTFQPRSKNPARWMTNQERWIRKQIRSGRSIYDIGTDARRATRSAYYAAEREALIRAGYTRVFRGWVNVDFKGKIKKVRLYEWVP